MWSEVSSRPAFLWPPAQRAGLTLYTSNTTAPSSSSAGAAASAPLALPFPLAVAAARVYDVIFSPRGLNVPASASTTASNATDDLV